MRWKTLAIKWLATIKAYLKDDESQGTQGLSLDEKW
jgi:hypothetical protein